MDLYDYTDYLRAEFDSTSPDISYDLGKKWGESLYINPDSLLRIGFIGDKNIGKSKLTDGILAAFGTKEEFISDGLSREYNINNFSIRCLDWVRINLDEKESMHAYYIHRTEHKGGIEIVEHADLDEDGNFDYIGTIDGSPKGGDNRKIAIFSDCCELDFLKLSTPTL